MRVFLLLAIVAVATWGANLLKDALDLTIMPTNEQQMHRMVMLGMVAYAMLLALPFVPGAEIGFALLTVFGAPIAPLVYSATVLAMMLAYMIGRLVPAAALARALGAIRLVRAAELLRRAAPLSREERVAMVMEGASPRTLKLALRHRYLAVAILVNTPGNSLIGGGGGIMMLAGISGLFAPLPTFFAVALAVSPVPLVVIALGGLPG